MIAANPLSPAFKVLLDAIGAALAFLYRYIPNYGVDIILLTLAIRVLLLPLAIKQIRVRTSSVRRERPALARSW